MKMLRMLLLLLLLLFPGCASDMDSWSEPKTTCNENSDCGDGMLCKGEYCIHEEPEEINSSLRYKLKITPPDNFSQGREYQSESQTYEKLLQKREFELPATTMIPLKGYISSIVDEEDPLHEAFAPEEIYYSVIVTTPNNPDYQGIAQVIKYHDGGQLKIKYEIKLQEHYQNYILTVIPDRLFPRQIIELKNISKLKNEGTGEIVRDIPFSRKVLAETHSFHKRTLSIAPEYTDIEDLECYIYTTTNRSIDGEEEIVSNRIKQDSLSDNELLLNFFIKNDTTPLFLKTTFKHRVDDGDQEQWEQIIQRIPLDQKGTQELSIPAFTNRHNVLIQNDLLSIGDEASLKITGTLSDGTEISLNQEYSPVTSLNLKLPSGRYTVQYHYSDYSRYASSSEQFEVKDKDLIHNHTRIQKVTHQGVLIGFNNEPLPNGSIKFINTDPDLPFVQSVLTDYDGYFFVDLQPGTYRVEIDPRHNNYAGWIYYNININADNISKIAHYTVPQGVNLLFEVYGERGTTTPGAQISLSVTNLGNYCNGINCPGEDILYRTVSDSADLFMLVVPVME